MRAVLATLRRRWKLALGLSVSALFVALLLVVGGAAGLAWTSTEAFCIGCHEMRANVYAEYKDTIHDRNRTGVRAICTDCHVPREPGPLLLRKMAATMELWGKLTGVIDTKEKFESRRALMATKVWTRMLKTDSHECRNCHISEKMNAESQTEKARGRHARGLAEGITCIECHFGIAHKEPEGDGPQELRVKLGLARIPGAAAPAAPAAPAVPAASAASAPK